ncbi:hypothetical protein ASPWEDRAFT_185018 [Aspergillus wentii DTO 134E9]|uniref:FAD-binding domain-containing protein n=1 Tax=Aspergillus wentii DTO 134E9 TaxID=1073089 RepID=A0A1L9RI42_ASPWE|nr:uncharacterized protein ASPWEDRAFT_185018 [Aspergillus wentii DTO 134E9]OJJ34533.1 hypothetical protein ASPWEDRAFT_185018 [Aspergillus wentii DTO 134E9]
MTAQPLDVVIIGAGIAGLSAAIALGKQGHRVVILEKSRFAKETGAAIHMPPNCTAMLNWMGVDPKDFGGTLLEQMHRYDHLGNVTYIKDFNAIRSKWQAEFYLVHRVELHNFLKKRALETSTLHTGCAIVDADVESARPSVTLQDGRVFEGDLLLGADGAHSFLRNKVTPNAPVPFAAGKSCFRWLIPTSELKKHTSTEEFVKDTGVFIEWAASDRRIVAYPCSDSKVFNLCGFVPTAEAGGYGDGWQATGNRDSLIRAFSDFSPGVRRITESADEGLKVWGLSDMEALPTWVKHNSALLGDAAHPFQPYMGQGGAMAIEDAVSLATLLPAGVSAADIPSRLAIYEKARRPRVDMIMEYTRMNARDEDKGGRIPPEEMVRFMGICFSHNEIEHSAALLEESG